MNALQIKVSLFRKGLTISEIARRLAPIHGATFDSMRTMLTNLFYHGVRNDKLAALVKEKYGIIVDTPAKPSTVREAVQRAAA